MLLAAEQENGDGETWDIAGPVETATSNLASDRVWLANGRKRMPLRASNRERMEAEVRDFTAFGGHLDLRFERPIAVEYGQTRKRLYTLTEGIVDGASQTHRWCLYAEDVSVPSNPVQLAVHRFLDICPYPPGLECDHSKHWPWWDPVQDIKLWEGTGNEPDLIVARTRKRLVTIQLKEQNGTFSFDVRGWASELFNEGRGPEATWSSGQPWFHDSSGFIDLYKIAFLIDVAVELDQNGRMMAYALVESGAYGVSRPLSQMVIACDLNKAGGYQNPTFDADPGPCIRYVVFNPLEGVGPVGTDLSAADKEAHSAYHIDAYQAPLVSEPPSTGTFLYVACGSAKQVQRVNVTNLFPQYGSTSDCGPSIILHPNTSQAVKLTVSPSQNIRHIMADPDAPGTRFVALAQDGTHIWENGIVVASSTNEPNSLGPNRDSFIMKVPAEVPGTFSKHAWLALSNQVDHIGKVFNVTNGVMNSVQLLPTRGQYYGINSSDGAVAIGNHVYLPNFSGVARYELVGGKFQYAEESYKPCEVPPDGGFVGLTEHIDRGLQLPRPGILSPEDQIYTVPAVGAEYMFPVHPGTRNPLDAVWIPPNNNIVKAALEFQLGVGNAWPYNCQESNSCNPDVYGNDNVYVDISEYAPGFTNRYLINDMTKNGATGQSNHQIVLNVFWWDKDEPPFGKWFHMASVASPPIDNAGSLPVGGQSITIAKHPSTGMLAAFVGHSQGVMVFEMEGLKASTGSGIGALVYKQNIATTSGVSGLAVVEDHVFFVENGVNVDNAKMKGYTWDPLLSPPLDIDPPDVWTMALKDALPADTAPRNPGQARRARVRNLPGSTGGYPNRHIYFAQDPYLIQWKWPGDDNGTPKPNELDLTGYWRSDYDSFMQDCRIHDFPGLSMPQGMTYVLVARETESFAIVGPIE